MAGDDVVQAGDTLGQRYRLLEEIGRGGVGAVWRADDLERSRQVALKVISPLDHLGEHSVTKVGRFIREARAMAKLKSPHIVKIHDHGECPSPDGSETLAYIAMELLSGEPLRDRIKRGALSPETTMRVMAHVGRAVGFAHQRGIVHRDLKPANIFLSVHPDHEFIAKVLDYGMVKSLAAPLATMDVHTELGRPLGTPYYMSPEQARGLESVDHRSDLWALGVLAYECLLGERPFQGKSLAKVFSSIAGGEIPVPSRRGEVPPGFDAWFAHAVNRDKQQRFQSAKMMIDELQEVLVDASTLSNVGATLSGTLSDVLAGTAAPPGFGERTLVRESPTSSASSFVGRAEVMQMMDSAVGSHSRVITLCGGQGAGRSRVAREWASRRRDLFAGGVWLCSLAGVRDPGHMWLRLSLALGGRLGDVDPALRLGRALTGLGRVLVVLERVEGVRKPLAAALGRLLHAAPRALFVLTSNKPLDVKTERVVPVDDLPFPPFGARVSLAELKSFPAVELFIKRAFAFDRGIADEAAADAIGGVVRRTNGSPLGLEVLAARVDTCKPAEMARALDGTLIQPGGTTLIVPDAIVRGVARWAVDQLTPPLRSTLIQCAAFRGSFTPQAAEAVIDLGAWQDAPPVSETLNSLCLRNLLRRSPDGSEMRYDAHPVVHHVCDELLIADPALGEASRPAVFARHGRFFAQLGSVEALDAVTRRGGWVRRHRYLIDVDNLIAAMERAIERTDREIASACALAVAKSDELMGRPAAAAQRLVAPIAIGEGANADTCRCLVAQALALAADGRFDAAHRALASAVHHARALGASAEEAAGLCAIADLHLVSGRASVAYTTAEQARQLSLRYGDRMGHAEALCVQANAQRESGDAATAKRQLDEARMVFVELGARRREAACLETLGELHADVGRSQLALDALEAALTIHRELGDRYHEARTLGVMGEQALGNGDFERAGPLLEQACGRGRELGACELEGRFMGALGSAYTAQNDVDRGWDALASAEHLLRTDRPNGSVELLVVLCRRARIEVMRNAGDAARATLHEIEALATRVGSPPMAVGRELVALRHALRVSDPPSVF